MPFRALLVEGDRAAETIPMELIESPLAWSSGTKEALQVEETRYSSHSFPLVFRGARGFSSSFPSHQKRVAKRDCSRVCGLGIEVVEADVSIRPLSVVLADKSVATTPSREERALVVVGKTSPKEINFMRWLECATESTKEWKSSCLAQFSDFLGMPTMGFEEDILALLKKWIMRKEQKNRWSGVKKVKVESSRSKRELRRLDYSVNFKSAGSGRALS